jgi:hypothetical protein
MSGRIRSIEKSNDLIGNRTRDIPACSRVPQPTSLPRTPLIKIDTVHKQKTACYFVTLRSLKVLKPEYDDKFET